MNARRAVRRRCRGACRDRSGGGDVEEDDLVGALARRSARRARAGRLVDEVDEARALRRPARSRRRGREMLRTEHQAGTATPAAWAATMADEVASRRSPSAPLRSGWNWTPTRRPARPPRRTFRRASSRPARPASGGTPGVRVDEVEVGAAGRSRRTPGGRGGAPPGSSRCGEPSGARRAARSDPAGRRASAPSSSLPSNSSWRPRQIPRNGRPASIQRRRSAPPGRAPGGAPSPAPPRPLPGPRARRPRARSAGSSHA